MTANIWRSLVVALAVAWLGTSSAVAQPAPTARPTEPIPADNTAPAANAPASTTPAIAGAASGAGPQGGTAAPGAPAAPTEGSAAVEGAGSGVARELAGAGSGAATTGAGGAAPVGGLPATGGAQWYDVLADRPISEGGTFWLPKSVNVAADPSDFMFYAVLALSIFFFVGITAVTLWFTWRYRHRPGHKAEPSSAHNDAMEITWTVIPTIITVFLFWYGWRSYIYVVTPPQKAVEVNVLAWRWNWQFTHYNGVTDSDLHVPVNTPVRLVMTSKDVLHAFYAPAFRVKQDIIPRRYTYVWFEATKPGTYRLNCAEYCGTAHAQMGCLQEDKHSGACLRRAVVVVHSPGDYERYLADKASESMNLPPAELGARLFEKKGCNACHTIDGTPRVGPTFKGAFGSEIQLASGQTIKVDETYIRESILVPTAKSRPGFPPSMPSFEGQLKEKEIEGLVAFIKSLGAK